MMNDVPKHSGGESVRRNLALTLGIGAALAIGVAAIANGTAHKFDCFRSAISQGSDCPGRLILKLDGGITPKATPKHEMAPVAVKLRGKISTENGGQPSALREATIDFDKNGALNATGLPACGRSQLETRNTQAARQACRKSIVGSGMAHVAIASSEQLIPLPLILFNGGIKNGTTTLFIRSSIAVPTPTPIVATVKLSKVHEGRYGLQAIAKIPPIDEGNGSLLEFSLKVKRLFTNKGTQESYAMARCPDGHLDASILSAVFKNEAKIPGVPPTTTLKGTVIRPCTSKG
jgi:hypothetical protein